MELKRIWNVNIDAAPTDLNTNDRFVIPIYNANQNELKFRLDFTIESGQTNGALADFVTFGSFNGVTNRLGAYNFGDGKYAFFFRGTILPTPLSIDQGDRVDLDITHTEVSSGNWETTFFNRITENSFTVKSTDKGYADGDDLVVGSTLNVKFDRIDNNGEIIDCLQNTSGNLIHTEEGRTGVISTDYSANKPAGTHIPNYTDDNDYINTVIRSDKVARQYSHTIYALSNYAPIVGASVAVNIEGGGILNLTTNDKGEVNFPATTGAHTYDITHADFNDLTSQPFTVVVLPSSVRSTLTLTELYGGVNKVVDSSTKIGTNESDLVPSGTFIDTPQVQLLTLKNRKIPFTGLTSEKYRPYSSVDQLKGAFKGKVGDMAYTQAYISGQKGGGSDYELVSVNAVEDGYTNNYGAVVVTSMNDAYISTEYTKNASVSSSLFGLRGDGILEDYLAVQALFDYASENKLKIILEPNRHYVLDGLTKETRPSINKADYYHYLDGRGSRISRHWEVKAMPLRLLEKTLIGTFTSYTKVEATKNDDYHSELAFSSNSTAIGRKILKVGTATAFNALNSSSVNNNDYVLFTEGDVPTLRKVLDNTQSPVSYEEDLHATASGTLRDRFFIANNDLTKRCKVFDDFDNQTGTVITTQPNEDFSVGENLYFYNYVSDRVVADSASEPNINYTVDIPNILEESLYRAKGDTTWEHYQDGDIPKGAIELFDFQTFKWKNVCFDDDRPDKDSLDLSVNTDGNFQINESDQVAPWAWNSLIERTNGLAGNRDLSYFGMIDCVFKNNNMQLIVDLNASMIKFHEFKNLEFQDSGYIRVTNNLDQLTLNNKLEAENIRVTNPYSHHYKNFGIDVRGIQAKLSKYSLDHAVCNVMGFGGVDQTSFSDSVLNNPITKKLNTSESPFFNGKCLTIKNGEIRQILGKTADTGFRRSSYVIIDNIKIPSIYETPTFEMDNDPITGNFLSYHNTVCWYTRMEDGAGNLHIRNSDIVGTIQNVKPTTPRNSSFQQAGAMNSSIVNCTAKVHSKITKSAEIPIDADFIFNLTAYSLEQNSTLSQHKFFNNIIASNKLILSARHVSYVRSYVPVSLRPTGSYSDGFFTENPNTDDYDTVESIGVYDDGLYGGAYTQRQPIPTEVDSAGNKKIVAAISELVNVGAGTVDFGSGFQESYKGGYIEVSGITQIDLNSGHPINRRFRSGQLPSQEFYWGSENSGSDKPHIPIKFEHVLSPSTVVDIISLNRSVKDYINFEHIYNIPIDSSFPDDWTGGSGTTRIKFFHCTMYRSFGATTTQSAQNSFLDYFRGSFNNVISPIMPNKTNQFVAEYYHCKYVSSYLGHTSITYSRKDLLDIDVNNIDILDGSNWENMHPQIKNVYHRDNEIIDLDAMLVTDYNSNKNQSFTIFIDDNSPTGRGILINGVTYTANGEYRFVVDHTFDTIERFTGASIRLLSIDNRSSNATGSVIDLSDDLVYNAASGDTKNHSSYTIARPKANKSARCLVQFTQLEIDALTGGIPSFTGFTVSEVASSEALVADQEMYMTVWCDDDTTGSEIIRMKIHSM